MIGTDENRAVLHVEVIFWSGKRKTPPSLVSGKYCPHFVVIGTTEYLGVCFLDGTECTFDEPALGNAQPLYPRWMRSTVSCGSSGSCDAVFWRQPVKTGRSMTQSE